MRVVVFIVGLLLCSSSFSATLEQLSIEQMAQQATTIVRGRVTGCSGEMRGAVIYTRCGVAVTETWKGNPAAKLDFIVPGGTARGLSQTFSGAPKFSANEQFVLFLWVGRSGIPQIIGLSQGVFDVSIAKTGQVSVSREASSELMLNSVGKPVADQAVNLSAAELRARVDRALRGGGQ